MFTKMYSVVLEVGSGENSGIPKNLSVPSLSEKYEGTMALCPGIHKTIIRSALGESLFMSLVGLS